MANNTHGETAQVAHAIHRERPPKPRIWHIGVSSLTIVLLLIAMVPGLTAVNASTSGIWSPTSNMGANRLYFTATLLLNGKVLVTGSASSCNTACIILRSAELYDPATGSWTPTGSMHQSRGYHTATLLKSGKVLVVGGVSNSVLGQTQILTTTELYDPNTGTWTVQQSLKVPHVIHTATRLSDGRVLVAGGSTCNNFCPTADAEIYNPTTGMWTQVGSLLTARYRHTSSLLPNGKVLIAGGDSCACSGNGTPLSSAEIFDPSTNTFTAAASMAVPHQFHTATTLKDGRILVAGGGCCGIYDVSATTVAEIYDPATGTWSTTGSMTYGRQYHGATRLSDGRVLVVGGDTGPGDTAEIYDPSTATWSVTGSMGVERYVPTLTWLPDGQVLVAGGGTCCPMNILNSAQLYTP